MRAGRLGRAMVPTNKGVVLGQVSGKLPELEPRDRIARCIEEASRYVQMDGNLPAGEERWNKLRLVVETAGQTWNDA